MQRVQSLLAKIICNKFDNINSRGIDLVRSLKLQAARERRNYFLCVLMFKCIHGLAPQYLSKDVTIHVDMHGYGTIGAESRDEICTCFFFYSHIHIFYIPQPQLSIDHAIYSKLQEWAPDATVKWCRFSTFVVVLCFYFYIFLYSSPFIYDLINIIQLKYESK